MDLLVVFINPFIYIFAQVPGQNILYQKIARLLMKKKKSSYPVVTYSFKILY